MQPPLDLSSSCQAATLGCLRIRSWTAVLTLPVPICTPSAGAVSCASMVGMGGCQRPQWCALHALKACTYPVHDKDDCPGGPGEDGVLQLRERLGHRLAAQVQGVLPPALQRNDCLRSPPVAKQDRDLRLDAEGAREPGGARACARGGGPE